MMLILSTIFFITTKISNAAAVVPVTTFIVVVTFLLLWYNLLLLLILLLFFFSDWHWLHHEHIGCSSSCPCYWNLGRPPVWLSDTTPGANECYEPAVRADRGTCLPFCAGNKLYSAYNILNPRSFCDTCVEDAENAHPENCKTTGSLYWTFTVHRCIFFVCCALGYDSLRGSLSAGRLYTSLHDGLCACSVKSSCPLIQCLNVTRHKQWEKHHQLYLVL